MTGPFEIRVLATSHRRDAFSCGVEALDRYLRQQVSQDIRRNLTNCFVLVDGEGAVAGFYTLSAASLTPAEMPVDVVRKLPRYPILPAALVGRLAVDARFRGRGFGGDLLVDAVSRARRSEAAIFALTVDAKDDKAAAFYIRHGFRPLASAPNRLFFAVIGGMAGL